MSEHFNQDDAVLLVVEGRAATPAWPPHLGAPPPLGWGMLEQEEWEPISTFLRRVNDTLDRSVLDDTHAETVVVVLGDTLGETSAAARRLLLLAVMTHFAHRGCGTVLLTHGVQHGPALHDELAELAADLALEWEDAGIAVHARAEGQVPHSEIRKTTKSEAPRHMEALVAS
jgi:hypothetical protein